MAVLSLLRAGFDVHVYEQATELREVGASIQVSPNASRVLNGLGHADAQLNLSEKPLAEGTVMPYVPYWLQADVRLVGNMRPLYPGALN